MNATVITTGSGGKHRHGDGVEELAVVQPAVLSDDAAVQEGHDGQTIAEHERPGLHEEPEELGQDGERPDGQVRRRRPPTECGRRLDDPACRAEQEEEAVVGFRPARHGRDHGEDPPLETVASERELGELLGRQGDDPDDRGPHAVEGRLHLQARPPDRP